MQSIRVIMGVPGSGKTKLLLSEIAENPARYLVAMPTKRLIAEAEVRIRTAAKTAGTSPSIMSIHSNQRTSVPVARAIADLPRLQTSDHVIVLVTHEGLMEADLGGFDGWWLFIDELPNAVSNGSMVIPIASRVLDDAYTLTHVSRDWHRVSVKNAEALNDTEADDIFKATSFHRRARQGRVFVDVPRFDALVGKRKAVNWFSAWTLDEVAAFERVTIAGASVLDSLLLRMATGIDVEVVDISPVRTGTPTIVIRYYADQHCGSSTFWKTALGQTCLSAVAADLVKRDIGYWSCNDDITMDLAEVGGRKVPPKVAGLNALRDLESCAYIYSAKALPTDVALRTVFGLTDADIKRQRETEDVNQFVFRGAPRNTDYGGLYFVYVYDHEQATTQADIFRRMGFPVELELVDTAVSGIVREQKAASGGRNGGRKPTGEAPMTAAERKRRQRANERKVKEARASFGGLA